MAKYESYLSSVLSRRACEISLTSSTGRADGICSDPRTGQESLRNRRASVEMSAESGEGEDEALPDHPGSTCYKK